MILVGMSSAKIVMSGRVWRGRNIECVRRNLVSRNVEGREFGGEIGTRLINRGHRPRAGASHNGLEVFLNMKHYLIY